MGEPRRIRIPNNWDPRPHQQAMWNYLEGGGKRAVMVAHRRWGKDDVALHWTCSQAHEKIASYLHMLPLANQARKAIWNAVNPHTGIRRIDEAFPIELRESTQDHEMFIRFKCGSTWQVAGSDNFAGLIGTPPYGVVFSEWSLADPEAWSQLMPILRENHGWAIFIYTPKGKNHGWSTLKAAENSETWFSDVQPIAQTKLISEDDLAEELQQYQSLYGIEEGQAYFDQEYNCSFNAPLLGSYYGSYLGRARADNRVGVVPYEPGIPVYTGWDLGRSDDTAIWFAQRQGLYVRIIDYYRSNGHTMDHYAKILQDKPYIYAGHILPHDASNKLMHSPDSLAFQLMALGVKNVSVLPNDDIDKGIHAVRQLLPLCYFDEVKCADGLSALESYHREWDEKRKMFQDTPCHDWASHPADAFRYLAHGLPKSTVPMPKSDPMNVLIGGKSTMTLNEAYKRSDRMRKWSGGRI